MSYANRVGAAIVLLVSFGLASSFQILCRARGELRAGVFGRDQVTVFGTRLQGIQRDLPRYGVVGYVADPPNDIETNLDYTRELVWVRYWLAPLVVLPYSHHHLVIGNFHKPAPTKLLSEWHLVLIKDYGNGMMLFLNKER